MEVDEVFSRRTYSDDTVTSNDGDLQCDINQ